MNNPPIPEHGNALTVGWMQQALSAGGGDFPTIKDIVVEDVGAGLGTMSQILRCTMTYHDDAAQAPESVVIKLSSSDKTSLRIARILSLYKREYLCFRQLASQMRIGLPALVYGDFEDTSRRFVMVLEDLRDMEKVDQITGASAARAKRVIRGVAELHGQFWNRLEQPPLSDFFASVGLPKRWLSPLLYLVFLAPCLERFGKLFSDRMRSLAEAYGPRLFGHMNDLATGPQTLTHGDFRLDNMFFGAADTDDFTVIDWQAAGLTKDGLYDVAYFMVTSVPTEVRRRIERTALEEYHSIVCGMGAKDFTFEECWRRYRQNMLGILVFCICACGGLSMTNQRIRMLGETMVQRTLAAIEDLDADEFLPTHNGFLTTTNVLSILSSCAYKAYKLAYTLYRTLAGKSPRT